MPETFDFVVCSRRALVPRSSGIDEESCVAPACVAVRAGRIARILSWDEVFGSPLREELERRGIEVIDLGERPLVPAFVNAHTHLALAPLRGVTSLAARGGNVVTDVFFQVEEQLTPEDVLAFTRVGAYESLLCGVAEVWDHYYHGEAVAQALAQVGLSGVVAPTLQDLSGPGRADSALQLEVTERIHENGELARRGIRAAFGPHASDTVSDELLRAVGEKARKLGVPVHFHLAQAFEEVHATASRFPRGLATEFSERLGDVRALVAHGLYLNDADCQQLVERKWVLAYCPLSQLQFGYLSPVRSWLAAGGRLAVGTDCVASNDALDVQRELPILAGDSSLSVSFSNERRTMLESRTTPKGSATWTSACSSLDEARRRLLRGPDVTSPAFLLGAGQGSALSQLEMRPSGIREGAWAHMLVLRPDHPSLFPDDDLERTLAYGATTGAIEWMIVAGEQRGRKGGVRSLIESEEYREHLEEARRRRSELLERVRLSKAGGSS